MKGLCIWLCTGRLNKGLKVKTKSICLLGGGYRSGDISANDTSPDDKWPMSFQLMTFWPMALQPIGILARGILTDSPSVDDISTKTFGFNGTLVIAPSAVGI